MAKIKHPENKARAYMGSELSKPRPGFSVGPANLPDGVHKRKGIQMQDMEHLDPLTLHSPKDQAPFDTQSTNQEVLCQVEGTREPGAAGPDS